MNRVTRITMVTGAVLATALVASSVVGTQLSGNDPKNTTEKAALTTTRVTPEYWVEQKVDALLKKMTTKEKLQQVQLLSDGQITDADAKAGVGGVFSLTDPAKINTFQKIAVEQSRLHIPILFAYDTIHGYRTIFPVPLGAASSFDPKVAQTDASIGARESATVGIKQIYSPMVDVSARATLGTDRRGQRRGPLPRLRDGHRSREGRPGQRLLRDGQDAHLGQALRGLRPAGGRS